MKQDQATNWALLYKSKNGQPHEFRELRRVNANLWLRSGEVKTWTECTTVPCKDVDAAKAEFQRLLAQQATDGFELVREFHYDPTSFDFEQLRTEIREGARKAFTASREARPHETINSFALITDSGFMTIIPVTNSDAARLKKGVHEDYVWNSGEWSYSDGNGFLDIAYRMILTQHQDPPTQMDRNDFCQGFQESIVKALEDLDREGFFGVGAAREEIVVLFQITDSDYDLDAIRRLNTAKMYQRFRAWYDSWN